MIREVFMIDEGAAKPLTSGATVRPDIEEAGNALVFFNCIKLALNSGVSKCFGHNRQQSVHNI